MLHPTLTLLEATKTIQGLPVHVGSPTGEDSLIVPFAMPLVAGPGAITTAVALAARTQGPSGIIELLSAVAIVGAILFVALASADVVGRHISQRAHAIIIRFLG